MLGNKQGAETLSAFYWCCYVVMLCCSRTFTQRIFPNQHNQSSHCWLHIVEYIYVYSHVRLVLINAHANVVCFELHLGQHRKSILLDTSCMLNRSVCSHLIIVSLCAFLLPGTGKDCSKKSFEYFLKYTSIVFNTGLYWFAVQTRHTSFLSLASTP